MNRIYLDHAASTPVAPEVVEAMIPFFRASAGNPSSPHDAGVEARQAVSRARDCVAVLLGCESGEIVFTGGGSESDSLAILGTASALEKVRRHIVTSMIEHPAVDQSCRWLESRGWKVDRVPVGRAGVVDPEEVRRAIRPETALVSIMHANNEVGTLQPVETIGEACRAKGVLFHTDAVQSVGHVRTNVREMNVDMLTLSAHKFGGPKGVGALFVRDGVTVHPIIHGGGHEKGRRSGTENVPGIVGLGRAAELALRELSAEAGRIARLRDRLIEGIVATVPGAIVTGDRIRRLPNNASVLLPGISGDAVVRRLNAAGVAASSGSACSSGSIEPSRVLRAMGFSPEGALGSLRLTLGRETSEEDIECVLHLIPEAVETVRALTSAGGLLQCDCGEEGCG